MNKNDVAELVERLRDPYSLIDRPRKELEQADADMLQAADAITTLSAENEALQARVDVLEANNARLLAAFHQENSDAE